MSHGTTRELHLATAFHKVRGASAALPTGRPGQRPPPRAGLAVPGARRGSAVRTGPAERVGRSGGASPPLAAPSHRAGAAAAAAPPGPRMPARREKPGGIPALLAAPSAPTRVPPLHPLAGGADATQTIWRTPEIGSGAGGSAATPCSRSPGPGASRPHPTSLRRPARHRRAHLPGPGSRDTGSPRRRRAVLRTLGAAPRPPLPAAERPLPRPCASAGAGAGRGAVAAREEG